MIEHYSFGKIVISGNEYRSDILITSSGKVIPDWYRKKGHSVMVEDIRPILDPAVKVLILGKGKPGFMKASAELKQYLQDQQIELIETSSSKAADHVNQLIKIQKPFAAGFHLTC